MLGFEKVALGTAMPKPPKMPMPSAPAMHGKSLEKPPRYNSGSGSSMTKLFRTGKSPTRTTKPGGVSIPKAYNMTSQLGGSQ